MDKSNLLLRATWVALLVVFGLIVSQIFIPAIRDLFRGSLVFLIPLIVWFLLGLALIFFTLRAGISGILRKFLILSGASAAGFLVSVFLHNLFYGLAIITSQIALLSSLMAILHLVFFLTAIFICPLGFLVGLAGTITLFVKERRK